MAYLVPRSAGRFEIRESLATPAGPRSRTLASFRPPLAPDVLERAASRATLPFDAADLLARAQALDIATTGRREDRAARALLARLRSGSSIDPALAAQLREALTVAPAVDTPPVLADVGEWIGVPPERRGATLRDLVRLADRIIRSRGPRAERARDRFPRFSSRRARSARAARAR